jgi:hypothetical protein
MRFAVEYGKRAPCCGSLCRGEAAPDVGVCDNAGTASFLRNAHA